VNVGGEVAGRRITDDRRGACNLVAYTIQHATVDAWHGGSYPVQSACMNDGTTAEVCVQIHRYSPNSLWRI